MTLELVRDIKETLCRVSENPFDTEYAYVMLGTPLDRFILHDACM